MQTGATKIDAIRTYEKLVRDRRATQQLVFGAKCHHLLARCYLDIGIGNRYAGRIIVGLYSDTVNFSDSRVAWFWLSVVRF